MKIVIAPDSLKGSADAGLVADALADGWRAERADDVIVLAPQADGGEGTASAVARAIPGSRWRSAGIVTGPDGREVNGAWLELPDGTAVAELALTSGLPLMAEPDALRATTRGLGEVLRDALRAGAPRLVIGLGGSASTDGAAGALAELGAQWLDDAGTDLPDGGGALVRLARADLSNLLPPPVGGVELLVDVEQPLCGREGAAAVFGPQKGASPDDVHRLDRGLARLASVLGGEPERPGSGAAGGAAFGLATAWGATLVPGAARIAELSGLEAHLADADLLITGEGRLDATSLRGKVVGNALDLARRSGTRPAVVAGLVDAGLEGIAWTCSLAVLAGSAAASMRDPLPLLREAGRRAARELGR